MKAHDRTDTTTALAELGRIKLGETDLHGVLHRILELAGQALPAATEVSITLSEDRGPYTAAHSGEAALRLDELQYDRDAGPCLEAARTGTTVVVPDTAADDRWDGWAAEAARVGMGSVLSLCLPLREDAGGALNVYAAQPSSLDGAVAPAEAFARHAAVTLANAHLYDSTAALVRQMKAAMASRAVIEQAKGIIMGERRCGADEAFTILTRISQDTNRKLRDVAAALVERTSEPRR